MAKYNRITVWEYEYVTDLVMMPVTFATLVSFTLGGYRCEFEALDKVSLLLLGLDWLLWRLHGCCPRQCLQAC